MAIDFPGVSSSGSSRSEDFMDMAFDWVIYLLADDLMLDMILPLIIIGFSLARYIMQRHQRALEAEQR
jgi:hypothetical protein